MAMSPLILPSFHRREARRQEELVRDRGDDRAVLFGLGPRREPFGIGAELRHLRLALRERFPFEEVCQVVVAGADQRRPEPGLMDRVLLPKPQGDRVEAPDEIGQPTRHAVVDAQFVNHDWLLSSTFCTETILYAPRRKPSPPSASSRAP